MSEDSFWNNKEEFFIGACLQFPLYFIVGWWILPVMLVCGILWRLGGWSNGAKIFRWAGVPFVVCLSAFYMGVGGCIFLALPFMVKIAPSYGKESWLFKLLKNDFLTRLICFTWYWTAFGIIYWGIK
jgi:hypothetical protein